MTTIPVGPIEEAPWGLLPPDTRAPDRRALLEAVLAGVELGAYDRRILDWLADRDNPTVITIASLFQRAREAGVPR
jgi:hypothetical protein